MSPSLHKGAPWGQPATGPPDVEVTGGDGDLAAIAGEEPGRLVHFKPSVGSDLARAVGLRGGGAGRAPGSTEVPIDALRVQSGDVDVLAVNAVVVGRAPDRLGWRTRSVPMTVLLDGRPWYEGRATTVLVASGQHLRGHDIVPRGHPGDGWAEVQVYALRSTERAAMTRRLRTGTHVPHPGIRQGRARRIELRSRGGRLSLEVDGAAFGPAAGVLVTLVPGALRLLV